MGMPPPSDFKEFLKLCNSNGVEYLVIGGYAVILHGFVRTTIDMDVWVRSHSRKCIQGTSRATGVRLSGRTRLIPHAEHRSNGRAALRLEIVTSISGVDFE